jgi:hypothetical protein
VTAPLCSLVVNIDTDPDPAREWQTDASILAKYNAMQRILAIAGAPAAWCVLTGPICRTRFLEPPFLQFWREQRSAGADLVLHAEEDLYGPPPGKTDGSSSYLDTGHMRAVITAAVQRMRASSLDFDAYRGGYHGLTPDIAGIVRGLGVMIDLSCAPGIVWPEKAASWAGAPLSAYWMTPARPARPAPAGATDVMFEVPFAWDGRSIILSRRFVIGESFMINEFSTLAAMQAVWDAVQARAAETGQAQTVSMITHTYGIDRPEYSERLTAILRYVTQTGGRFVTPRQALAEAA